MENLRILDGIQNRTLRRLQGLGVAVGCLMAIIAAVFPRLYAHAMRDGSGFALVVGLLRYPLTIAVIPADALCLLFGWDWSESNLFFFTTGQLSVITLVNVCLFWLFGTIIGLAIAFLRRPPKQNL